MQYIVYGILLLWVKREGRSFDPANGIYPSELKPYVHARTRTQMFIAALFLITNLGATEMYFSR